MKWMAVPPGRRAGEVGSTATGGCRGGKTMVKITKNSKFLRTLENLHRQPSEVAASGLPGHLTGKDEQNTSKRGPSFDLMNCGSELLDNLMVEYNDGDVIATRIIAITEWWSRTPEGMDGDFACFQRVKNCLPIQHTLLRESSFASMGNGT